MSKTYNLIMDSLTEIVSDMENNNGENLTRTIFDEHTDNKTKGVVREMNNFEKYLSEQLKNPDFKKEWVILKNEECLSLRNEGQLYTRTT